jgi:tellurium resistance protein TerD
MSDVLDTQFDGQAVKLSDHKVNLGDDVNLLQKDPALRKICVGFGWDIESFNTDAVDFDVSLFLIGKDDKTRNDDDFVFYNQMETLDGGVIHHGDSRTGAGDGDDESITIDFNALPFDVSKLVFVISIYRGDEKQHMISMMKNAYMRVVNADTSMELLRYDLDEVIEGKTETAMIAAHINREGPKWHFVPKDEFVEGGLKAIAENFGIVIA